MNFTPPDPSQKSKLTAPSRDSGKPTPCRTYVVSPQVTGKTPRRVKRMLAITAKSFGDKKPSLILRSFPNPTPPYWILSPHTVRATASINASQSSQPRRPSGMSSIPNKGSLSGMCEAQRIDFIAACEGKITWKQYFDKWSEDGGVGLAPR